MVRKVFKWIGIIVGSLIVLVILFFTKSYISVSSSLSKKYNYVLQTLPITSDSAILAEGQRLIVAKGCTDCHGADLGGKVFIDDPALGVVTGLNITKGKGGLPSDFNEQDWLRALKHGVNRDSTSLRIMPSYETTLFSEEDVRALIAYGMQLKPVDRELPATSFRPLAYVLTDMDVLPVVVAERIDHSKPLTKIQPEVSIAYGKHLATGCVGCHKDNLKGGDPVIPGSPQVADITSAGNVGKWTEEEFISTLRTGKTPDGRELPVQFMPWNATQSYTDVELKALYSYLKSI